MSETIAKYKKYLLAQFAAESYLHGLTGMVPNGPDEIKLQYRNNNTLTGLLALGPNDRDKYEINAEEQLVKKQGVDVASPSSTAMTRVMIGAFAEKWEIVDQLENTASGFSATLLRNIDSGQYHLAFRSTESKSEADGGDVLRDSSNGANGEIGHEGFAWAQLMDMEQYYNDLCAGNLATGSSDEDVAASFNDPLQQLTVTGYSLGSHLAQVFTLMHYDKVEETHVFNGAGMGQFEDIADDAPDFREKYGEYLNDAIFELSFEYEQIKGWPDSRILHQFRWCQV